MLEDKEKDIESCADILSKKEAAQRKKDWYKNKKLKELGDYTEELSGKAHTDFLRGMVQGLKCAIVILNNNRAINLRAQKNKMKWRKQTRRNF